MERGSRHAVLAGAALGALLTVPAIGAAIVSGGAGHGHYVAARALFPMSMLMTLAEGSIGWICGSMALLQFPLYGALLGWSRAEKWYGGVLLVAALHLAAVTACFSGIIPSFS
jgi:hypothetical protein